MTDFPDVKLKAQLSFPANILGGTGIDATKKNGSVIVGLDYNDFGSMSAIPISPNNRLLTFDTATNSYVMIPTSLLGGAVAGISDAPLDGSLYGRQSAGWIKVGVATDAPLDGKVYGRQSAGWTDAWAAPTFTGLPVFSSTVGGYGFRMIGNGATTPSKYVRVNAGDFQITNDANTTILDLTDGGQLTTTSLVLNQIYGSPAQPLHISSTNPSGTVTSNSTEISVPTYNMNTILNAQDNIGLGAGANQLNTLSVINTVGGPQVNGARNVLFSQIALNAASSPTNPFKDYVAAQFFAEAFVNDGGTATAPAGALFATNPVALLQGNATFFAEVTGGEVNIAVQTNCTVSYKSAWTLVALNTDVVQGSVYDGALSISSIGGAIGWKHGILFSAANSQAPIHPAGTLIGTQDAGTVATGIDFTSYSITGAAIATPGFAVGGNGTIHTSTTVLPQLQIDNPSGQVSELVFSHASVTAATIAWDNTNKDVVVTMAPTGSNFVVVANGVNAFIVLASGVMRTGAAGFTANGVVGTQMQGVGPTGSHTTPQEWFTVQNSAGITRYIPAY